MKKGLPASLRRLEPAPTLEPWLKLKTPKNKLRYFDTDGIIIPPVIIPSVNYTKLGSVNPNLAFALLIIISESLHHPN